jgi:DNA-binding NtrC family response regulator
MTLRHAGYEVDTAENGRQAIQKSEMNFYNLALIDIRLPDMEGTELLTALKDTTPKMIKVILTGFPGQQNAITAINKGVDAYLIKPVSPGDLLRVVKERLEKQREEMAYSQDKIAEFVESRFKELETKERGAPAKRN